MICLINPFITIQERYGRDIGDIGGHQMPLGIYYLASYLRKNGEEVYVFDCEASKNSYNDIILFAKEKGIKIFGITSTTVGFNRAKELASILRQEIKDIIIVIGGSHVTAQARETMLTRLFDFAITHEGELSFLDLIRYIRYGSKSLEDIEGLLYFYKEELKHNSFTTYIEPLDLVPFPARDLCGDLKVYRPPVGSYKKRPVMNVITSRGCPYKCIFCDTSTFGHKVRFHSAEYVANELQLLISKYKFKEIAFLDDTFALNKDRIYNIFKLLDKNKISFPWTCMTRANILDEEFIKFMASKGCWQIRLGIESGNQKVLDFLKKGITLEQVVKVTTWCKKHGIKTTGFFMLGHHIDSKETIEDTIKFALSLPLTDIVTTINTPLPGTESFRIAKQYGTFKKNENDSYNYWVGQFIPNGLSRNFLLTKQAEFYMRFYLRPKIMLHQTSKIRSFLSVKTYVKNSILGLKFIHSGYRISKKLVNHK